MTNKRLLFASDAREKILRGPTFWQTPWFGEHSKLPVVRSPRTPGGTRGSSSSACARVPRRSDTTLPEAATRTCWKAGIIDPTKVVRIALENAVSVAGVLLMTEATLTQLVEPAKPKASSETRAYDM